MSYQGINFANQRLVPSDDGRLYQKIFNDGALYGCGLSYNGAVLTVEPGFLVIGGRQIELDAAERISINEAVSGYAQLVVIIDLTRTATKDSFNQVSLGVRYATAKDGFATLIQDDINGSGSRYEAQLALVSLGAGGITGIVEDMPQAAFRGAGGTVSLKVVGGTERPENPQGNTVWVNTAAEVKGYAVSATEPAAPYNGLVWLLAGSSASAPINVGGKNVVEIYPTRAYLYADGLWGSVVAQTYIDGAWYDWNLFLYQPGDNPGMVNLGWKYSSSSQGTVVPSVEYGAESMAISVANTYGGYSGVSYFPDKYNLSPYNKLKASVNISGPLNSYAPNNINGVFIWEQVDSGFFEPAAAASSYPQATGDFELEADISALSGDYYIGFGLRYESGRVTITVKEVVLE